MTENTSLSDEIDIMIMARINSLPFPVKCKVTKIIDSNHINIKIVEDELENVEYIGGTATIDKTGLLVFLNGSNEEFIVIL